MAGSVSARVLTDLDEVKASRGRFLALRAASDSGNPFAGPEWTLNWYAAFCRDPRRRRPWLLEVTRDGELLGIVPMWQKLSRLGPGVLHPVGRGQPWIGQFEIPGALAAPGEGREVGRAAVAHLCELNQQWTWAHVSLGDAAPWIEPDWLGSDRYMLLDRGNVATVVLPLTPDGPPFHPRRNLRESLRRSRNRLDREVGGETDGWRVRRHDDAVDVAAAFARLAELHGHRARRADKGAIHHDVLGDPAVREYVASTIADMAQCGLASVYELVIGETVIASQLVVKTARSTHLSLSGQLDRAWEFSAVTFLQWHAVRDAEAARHDLVDFSAGPIQSKLRWSPVVRTYHEFTLIPPRRAAVAAYCAQVPRMTAARLREAYQADRRTAR